ncbi:hypothetical protein PA598K_06176 [Paenibacillus sp. 598K]|uniref:hypothetical protein n=1 Tax=Paenibacillus sp. 598K TaxID=1117987 RepID=UPI000FF9F111|nr:hypothetical protein [Paenibacillus sp. 598K]GBF77619.1 hypothetical protein PA598K_06176 [Paenibacillus sp. 598K]
MTDDNKYGKTEDRWRDNRANSSSDSYEPEDNNNSEPYNSEDNSNGPHDPKDNYNDPRGPEDERLGRELRQELETHVFQGVELGADQKKEWMNMIKQQTQVSQAPQAPQVSQAPQTSASWWTAGRKRLVTGAVAAALLLGIGIPLLQDTGTGLLPGTDVTQPGSTVEPGPGSSVGGSQLSQLVTENPGSLEEAEAKLGAPIRLPEGIPAEYKLVEIASSGYPGEAAIRVHFQYETADGGYLTFSVDKQDATFPTDLFTDIDLGGATGQVFAQPALTELYWKFGELQYSLVGTLTEAQAATLASSTIEA